MQQNVALTDATEKYVASIDKKTGSLAVIEIAHHEIHEGEMFSVSQLLTATTSYLITVAADKEAHLVFYATADTAGANYIEFYPLVTTSADGSAFSQIFNRKTAGGLSPTTTIKTAPTVTSTLDATTRAFYGSLALANSVAGGLNRSTDEFILTPGKHLLRVTRAAGNIVLQASWYEEPLVAA